MSAGPLYSRSRSSLKLVKTEQQSQNAARNKLKTIKTIKTIIKIKKRQTILQTKMEQHSIFVTSKKMPLQQQHDSQLTKRSYLVITYKASQTRTKLLLLLL